MLNFLIMGCSLLGSGAGRSLLVIPVPYVWLKGDNKRFLTGEATYGSCP